MKTYLYPEIKPKIEKTWYKNGRPDFESKTFSNIDKLIFDLKN